MKTIFITLLSITFLFYGCSHAQYKPNPEAVKLNKAATYLGFDSVYRHPDSLHKSAVLRRAIPLLDQAIAVDSNYYTAYFNKSTFQIQLRLFDSALMTAKTMIKIRPNRSEPKILAGEIYDMMGDTVNAFKLYRNALGILDQTLKTTNKTSDVYWQNKTGEGILYILLNHAAQGREIFQEVLTTTADPIEKQLLQQYLTMNKRDWLHGQTHVVSSNPVKQ